MIKQRNFCGVTPYGSRLVIKTADFWDRNFPCFSWLFKEPLFYQIIAGITFVFLKGLQIFEDGEDIG